MRPLFIITARGGSKGIPRKNIKLLGGKPLIAYTVEAALQAQAKLGGCIIMSTDDVEIADTARSCGLSVEYMRPAELGGDNVGSREVLLHAMTWAEDSGISFDCVILLQPTSPLRTADDIAGTAKVYTDNDCPDMAVSVCPATANPYWDIFETDKNGRLFISKGDGHYTRRQDLPPVWQFNGAVYVINPASLKKHDMGAFKNVIPYIMPRSRSIDLDTPDDWERAEQIFARL